MDRTLDSSDIQATCESFEIALLPSYDHSHDLGANDAANENLDGCEPLQPWIPTEEELTAPQENQLALGLMEDGKPQGFTCGFCGNTTTRRKGTYRKTGQAKYVCSKCGRVPSLQDE